MNVQNEILFLLTVYFWSAEAQDICTNSHINSVDRKADNSIVFYAGSNYWTLSSSNGSTPVQGPSQSDPNSIFANIGPNDCVVTWLKESNGWTTLKFSQDGFISSVDSQGTVKENFVELLGFPAGGFVACFYDLSMFIPTIIGIDNQNKIYTIRAGDIPTWMYQRQNQGAVDEDDRFPDDVNAAFSDPNDYILMYYFIKKDTYCKKTWLGLAQECQWIPLKELLKCDARSSQPGPVQLAGQQLAQPPARLPIKPTFRPSTKPITRPPTKPITRPPIKPTFRPPTKPITRPPTKPTVRPPTKPITRPSTKPTAQSSKPSSVKPTEVGNRTAVFTFPYDHSTKSPKFPNSVDSHSTSIFSMIFHSLLVVLTLLLL